MTKRMLMDTTHAEETRVVVLDGNRLEDFDVETSTKRQLKGNIYLAKVVRVEPSLQACFVDYGGNRHGFLAFSEIHPDYYQIPVADRQRLIEQEEEEARREEEEADRELDAAPDQPRPTLFEPEPVEPADGGVTGEAAADLAPAAETASLAAPAALETTDESGATAELLHEASQPTASVVDAAVPAQDPPAAAADAPVAADPAPRAAGDAAVADAAATDAAPPAEAPRGEAPSGEAPRPEAAPPADAAAPHAAGDAGGGHPAGAAAHPDSDEPPDPPSRRAQPLIIDTDSIRGPVETGDDHEDGGVALAEHAEPAADHDTPMDAEQPSADTEHDYGDDIDEADVLPPETVGGETDSVEEQRERRMPPRFLRNYKIQEVIRRRQILLVQVVKEERGTKGAALTTYLSLAGRFCVLMPNSPRGGGISRKITSATDRRRLKEIIAELDMPKGMGLIVRTAGANRPKPEIRRDCEYLLRLWDDIREHTLKSVAPALIYEEASLIKRAIRDVYSRDIDEIQVDGEEGWKAAHEFMRMLMPSHAKKVQLWRDPSQPLFTRYQVEAQLDAMLQPIVQLRSGGYLVINQAEALVAIDVNSGRSTRERNVEETALRTNLEAADEVARQLRLRDLAGLIVIDFIDMEARKHNAMVERRIKEALKNDRARIQVGHISHFGLLEMSRQRLRPSLAETSFILCPHCGGTGHVRSTESAAIHVLRGIEDEGSKRRAAEIVVHVNTATALYILNHKRDRLGEIELRYGMRVTVLGDDTQMASQFRIDRLRPQIAREAAPPAITPDAPPPMVVRPEPVPEEPDEPFGEDETETEDAGDEEAGGEEGRDGGEETAEGAAQAAERRRRRRRRRCGGRREDGQAAEPPVIRDAPASEQFAAAERTDAAPEAMAAEAETPADTHIEGVPEHAEPAGDDERNRRRGRRGGRRRRREGDAESSPFAAPGADQPDLPPVYIGPTPANPFGGHAFDIFDVLEQAEANASARPVAAEAVTRPPPGAMDGPAEPAADSAAPATGSAEPTAGPADLSVAAHREAAPAMADAPVPGDAGPPAGAPAAAAPAARQETLPLAEPEIVNAGAPEPGRAEPAAAAGDSDSTGAAAAPEVTAAPEAAAAPAEVANDVAPEPAIRPILVGNGEEPQEKKRGWWRR